MPSKGQLAGSGLNENAATLTGLLGMGMAIPSVRSALVVAKTYDIWICPCTTGPAGKPGKLLPADEQETVIAVVGMAFMHVGMGSMMQS